MRHQGEHLIPHQENGCDCGVYCIMSADFTMDDLPTTRISDLPDMETTMRVQIAAAIKRGYLGY